MTHYNIPDIPSYEFWEFRKFVETAYVDSLRSQAARRKVEPLDVKMATSDLTEIPPFLRGKARADGKFVGYVWHNSGHMWVKPGRDSFDVRRTAIHELAHLRVQGESHGPKFRRVFGVALALWMRSKGHAWSVIRTEISTLVHRYRHYRKWTPQGRYNSYDSYWDRVRDEVNSIEQAARRLVT